MIIEMDDSYLEREYAEYIWFAPTKDIFIKSEKLFKSFKKEMRNNKSFTPIFPLNPIFPSSLVFYLSSVYLFFSLLNTLRTRLFKLFKRPLPGFLTILTL